MTALDAARAADMVLERVVLLVERYGVEPEAITIREPSLDTEDILRDVMDAAGIPLWRVPNAVAVVELAPADWAVLFLPVARRARQELARVVDLSDPAAAAYRGQLDRRSWVACTEDEPGRYDEPTTYQAVDSADIGIVWACSSVEYRNYEALRGALRDYSALPKGYV